MPPKVSSPPQVFPLPPLSASGAAAFVQGARLPLRAAGYLAARPRLWPLVLIPLVLNILVFSGLIAWGFSQFADQLQGFLDNRPSAWYWTAFLWTARILFGIVVLAVVYFIFTPVALLIASPFNDRLAESAERAFGFSIQDDRPLLKMVLGEALFVVLSEAKRLAVIIGISLLLLPLHWAPVLGTLIFFGWTCWCAALEFTAYAADRRHLGLRAKWSLLRNNLAPTFGFGVATVGLMLVPFLNVLMVPVGAVGGTLLFGMIEHRRQSD